MLVTDRRMATTYRYRLHEAETHAENQGRPEAADAFALEREALEHHVHGAMGVSLDELESGLRIEPPFEPLYPTLIRKL